MNPDPSLNPPTPPAPPDSLAAPARRASRLMIVLGILTILLAGGVAAMAVMVPVSDFPQKWVEQTRQIEAEQGVSWQTVLKLVAVFIAVPGVIMVGLGAFVRRGSMVAAVLGVVMTALVLLYLTSLFLQAAWAAHRAHATGALPLMIFSGAAIVLFALQIFWLAKAVINAGPLKVFNREHQAKAWQVREQHASPRSPE